MKKNIKKIALLVFTIFLITILLSFIITNQDISWNILFNNFDIQTELFSMGIPAGNENMVGVPSIKCPHCEAQGVEVWVIFGKACPRCGNPCD